VPGYDIQSVIGSGGMGVVYKARHRALHRTVAIKMVREAELREPGARERFYAEATACARLQHPNIIQIFEVGTAEPRLGEQSPSPFIAFEFADGGNLVPLTQKPQPAREAAQIIEKLARAIHAAHQLGVIHRDLKPANVLLTADGEPKVADFGVAKQLWAERDAEGRSVTLAGTVVGTPEYMAPEQAGGLPPAPAVDIYALGVILYQLLTARAPFQGATPAETFALIQHQEPVSPRQFQPGLSRDLETICLKCLEKEPSRRYASAEALADDLQRMLDDQPILARRASWPEMIWRWCQRNPLVAASLAGAVGTFLVAFALVSWSYVRAEAALQDEAWQRQEAQRKGELERWERYRVTIAASTAAFGSNVDNARRLLRLAPEEYRNWEWRHLRSRLDRARNVLSLDGGTAVRAEVSPEGRLALLANSQQTFQLWDTAGPRPVKGFTLRPGWRYISMGHDGRTLLFATADNTVVLRDAEEARADAVLRCTGPIISAWASQDGARAVTWVKDGTIQLWDRQTQKVVRASRHLRSGIRNMTVDAACRRAALWEHGQPGVQVIDLERGAEVVEFSRTGAGVRFCYFNAASDRLLTLEAFPSNRLRLWGLPEGRLLAVMRGHTNNVHTAAFSPDETRIASCSSDQTVCLWDAASGRTLARFKGHRGPVTVLAFSPDGTRLVSAGRDHVLRLWDASNGEPLAVLNGHTGDVLAVNFTSDGRTIVSGSVDGTVRLWDARAMEQDGALRGHQSFVYGVAFHPDGRRVASASWDGSARIWDADTGRQLARLNHGEAIVASVAFAPSGAVLASRTRDAVYLWDVASGRELHRWPVKFHGYLDTRLAFSRCGGLLATGGTGGAVFLWDVASRKTVAVLRGGPGEIRDVAFSPDGRWLVAAVEQNEVTIRVWDVARREQAQALRGHGDGAYAVAFNEQGTLLASGSKDGTVRLWDTETWEEAAVLKQGSGVYGVAFTPDGSRLACACADNSVRLWDTGRHQEVVELRGHEVYVHQVAFSPDGTRLVSASGDCTVRLWDTVPVRERNSGPRR
jgi:WD40 repeat protein/tRNA A-37 threonylcarbamoyl transferase component Bud32